MTIAVGIQRGLMPIPSLTILHEEEEDGDGGSWHEVQRPKPKPKPTAAGRLRDALRRLFGKKRASGGGGR